MLFSIHWKRALLLAALNVAAAGVMMLVLEHGMREQIKDQERSESVTSPQVTTKELEQILGAKVEQAQGEQTVTFDPCGMWVHYSAQHDVVVFGNIPAEFVDPWQQECPPAWSIEGRIVGRRWLPMTQQGFALRRRADLAFLALIAVEWLVIGAFPLRRALKFYSEPGSFITACTLLGSALALIRPIDSLARLPALIAAFAWLLWFGFLLWIPLRSAARAVVKIRKSR
jgi:hypothetical protein